MNDIGNPDEKLIVIMHEGSYSDRTWNQYWCLRSDLDAFMLLTERFDNGGVQLVLDVTNDAFGDLIPADPIAYSISRELYGIIKSSEMKPLADPEFQLAKKAFEYRISDTLYVSPDINNEKNRKFFGIGEDN